MENQQLETVQDQSIPSQTLIVAKKQKRNVWMIIAFLLAISLGGCIISGMNQSSEKNSTDQPPTVSQQLTPTNALLPTSTPVIGSAMQPTQTRSTSPTLSNTIVKQPPFGSLASFALLLTFPSLSHTSPSELLITDPQNRRTGIDPRTGITYDEIPEGFYDVTVLAATDGSGRTTSPLKEFTLSEPLDGSYTIEVIGIGDGSYSLEILAYDQIGDPASTTISGEITENSVDVYRMEYSSAPGSKVMINKINAVP